MNDCDSKSLHFTSRDPSFTVNGDGAVVAVSPVSVAGRGRTFSVWAQDNSGPESEMEVHLVHSTIHERKIEVGLCRGWFTVGLCKVSVYGPLKKYALFLCHNQRAKDSSGDPKGVGVLLPSTY